MNDIHGIVSETASCVLGPILTVILQQNISIFKTNPQMRQKHRTWDIRNLSFQNFNFHLE